MSTSLRQRPRWSQQAAIMTASVAPRNGDPDGQGIHDDACQGPCGAWRLRRAASDDDPVGGRRGRRPVARHRAPRAAHARRARLCRAGRPDIFAGAADPRARLRLSVDADLDRPRAAVDEGAQRTASANPARRRSCKAPRSSMSRGCRPAASCRRRSRSAPGCRHFTPRSAASCSAFSTKRRSGGG